MTRAQAMKIPLLPIGSSKPWGYSNGGTHGSRTAGNSFTTTSDFTICFWGKFFSLSWDGIARCDDWENSKFAVWTTEIPIAISARISTTARDFLREFLESNWSIRTNL